MRLLQKILQLLIGGLAVVTVILSVAHFLLRPNPDRAKQEQYAVLSDFIRPRLTGESHDFGSERGTLVILEDSVISDQWEHPGKMRELLHLLGSAPEIRKSDPAVPKSLFFEFLISNISNSRFNRRFSLLGRYALASKHDTRELSYDSFLRKFPNSYGYLTFYRVGFNRDLTEAFFYSEHVCGLCGEGKFVRMKKIDGRWTIQKEVYCWIS